jgi:hypothetical protein
MKATFWLVIVVLAMTFAACSSGGGGGSGDGSSSSDGTSSGDNNSSSSGGNNSSSSSVETTEAFTVNVDAVVAADASSQLIATAKADLINYGKTLIGSDISFNLTEAQAIAKFNEIKGKLPCNDAMKNKVRDMLKKDTLEWDASKINQEGNVTFSLELLKGSVKIGATVPVDICKAENSRTEFKLTLTGEIELVPGYLEEFQSKISPPSGVSFVEINFGNFKFTGTGSGDNSALITALLTPPIGVKYNLAGLNIYYILADYEDILKLSGEKGVKSDRWVLKSPGVLYFEDMLEIRKKDPSFALELGNGVTVNNTTWSSRGGLVMTPERVDTLGSVSVVNTKLLVSSTSERIELFGNWTTASGGTLIQFERFVRIRSTAISTTFLGPNNIFFGNTNWNLELSGNQTAQDIQQAVYDFLKPVI